MNTVNSLITLILLLVAVFSVATSNPLLASTNESNGDGDGDGDQGSEPVDDSGGAEPVPGDYSVLEGDDPNTEEEEHFENENDEDYTSVTCWNGEEVSELSDCPKEEPVIPNCDFDEFINEDNECEKIPEEPATAALPPCDGSLQNCVTPAGDVCLAGATTHECEESVTCPDGVTVVEELSDCPKPEPEPIADPFLPFLEADEFAPDEDCLFNVDQPKCTPPEGVDCPEGFGTNEDGQCFPFNEEGIWECPDGYHSVEDDETGQCYPDSEGCPEGMIFSENGHCIDKSLCEGDNPVDRCPDPVPIPEPDPDYPPYPPDQDCDDIGKKNIRVPPGDPHGLDRDKDGIGCEDNEGNGSTNRDKTKVIRKTTVINSATASASATTAEVSSCKLDGSADGILQKFDTAKYQACGLYVEGQKAYSDGFVAGCIQVGNTQLICQSFVDSSKLNMNIPATQTPTHATMQPTPQGITPAAVNN